MASKKDEICRFCTNAGDSYATSESERFRLHLQRVHLGRAVGCDVCGKYNFSTIRSLGTYFLKYHPDFKAPTIGFKDALIKDNQYLLDNGYELPFYHSSGDLVNANMFTMEQKAFLFEYSKRPSRSIKAVQTTDPEAGPSNVTVTSQASRDSGAGNSTITSQSSNSNQALFARIAALEQELLEIKAIVQPAVHCSSDQSLEAGTLEFDESEPPAAKRQCTQSQDVQDLEHTEEGVDCEAVGTMVIDNMTQTDPVKPNVRYDASKQDHFFYDGVSLKSIMASKAFQPAIFHALSTTPGVETRVHREARSYVITYDEATYTVRIGS